MHDALLVAYGPQHWWPAKTPFEVILGAYLTQNTAWKAVERSLENLRAAGVVEVKKSSKNNRPQTWCKLTAAGRKQLEAETANWSRLSKAINIVVAEA